MTLEPLLDGFPEEGTIFPVASVHLAVSDAPHPYHLAAMAAARENWARESAANPALFDGRMLFQRRLVFDGREIRGSGHVVPYSTFLLWRKSRAPGGYHLFGLPLLASADGAVIAIRMAARTANAGRVYCAAGSLDTGDIVDGVCDIDANMRREVLEETGLDLAGAHEEPGYHALHIRSVVTVFKVFRLPQTADVLLDRIRQHIAGDPEPEADAAVAIFDADPARHAYAEFMPVVLAWFFGNKDR